MTYRASLELRLTSGSEAPAPYTIVHVKVRHGTNWMRSRGYPTPTGAAGDVVLPNLDGHWTVPAEPVPLYSYGTVMTAAQGAASHIIGFNSGPGTLTAFGSVDSSATPAGNVTEVLHFATGPWAGRYRVRNNRPPGAANAKALAALWVDGVRIPIVFRSFGTATGQAAFVIGRRYRINVEFADGSFAWANTRQEFDTAATALGIHRADLLLRHPDGTVDAATPLWRGWARIDPNGVTQGVRGRARFKLFDDATLTALNDFELDNFTTRRTFAQAAAAWVAGVDGMGFNSVQSALPTFRLGPFIEQMGALEFIQTLAELLDGYMWFDAQGALAGATHAVLAGRTALQANAVTPVDLRLLDDYTATPVIGTVVNRINPLQRRVDVRRQDEGQIEGPFIQRLDGLASGVRWRFEKLWELPEGASPFATDDGSGNPNVGMELGDFGIQPPRGGGVITGRVNVPSVPLSALTEHTGNRRVQGIAWRYEGEWTSDEAVASLAVSDANGPGTGVRLGSFGVRNSTRPLGTPGRVIGLSGAGTGIDALRALRPGDTITEGVEAGASGRVRYWIQGTSTALNKPEFAAPAAAFIGYYSLLSGVGEGGAGAGIDDLRALRTGETITSGVEDAGDGRVRYWIQATGGTLTPPRWTPEPFFDGYYSYTEPAGQGQVHSGGVYEDPESQRPPPLGYGIKASPRPEWYDISPVQLGLVNPQREVNRRARPLVRAVYRLPLRQADRAKTEVVAYALAVGANVHKLQLEQDGVEYPRALTLERVIEWNPAVGHPIFTQSDVIL